MLRTATESAWVRFRGRDDLIPPGFSWEFVVAVDGCMAGIMIVSTLQRSVTDLPWSLLACAFALAPLGVFLTFGFKHHAPLAWSSATSATAVFLFATSTPVPSDYVPFALVTMAGAVGALTSPPLSLLALTSSAALLIGAAATHRLDNIALYLPVLGMGWLVGYLMHIQQQLIIRQRDAQQQLAEHAAGDERRRIAREVHDVIAHSLSVTLLHVTAARRARRGNAPACHTAGNARCTNCHRRFGTRADSGPSTGTGPEARAVRPRVRHSRTCQHRRDFRRRVRPNPGPRCSVVGS